SAKATLGTGSSILLNTGSKPVFSEHGMVTTICWSIGDRVDYALEGVIVTCGATVEWLKNQLGLFMESRETEKMATSVPDNNGVYLVPAFSGLGAPHWKMDAKAMITGLTFGADKNHLVRAALESIPFQIKDVISAMETESKTPLEELKIDGGISANRFVVQMMADLLHTPVVNIGIADVSALGAALVAGMEEGIYKDIDELGIVHQEQHSTQPDSTTMEAANLSYDGWKEQIRRHF
ncbi:MAG: FGGY-family carbohydrate kinase, partial [Bacteroidota bacterium]|nr:FGGY-family carbohydrate kinase [Bacteroidota bacterium]